MWAIIVSSGQIIYSHLELPNIHLKKLSVKTIDIRHFYKLNVPHGKCKSDIKNSPVVKVEIK